MGMDRLLYKSYNAYSVNSILEIIICNCLNIVWKLEKINTFILRVQNTARLNYTRTLMY